MALTMTARLFSLPKEAVITFVQVELPVVAKMADEHPAWLEALYAQPVKMLPEPRQEFSTRLTENPEARQHMVDAFQAMTGPMTESLVRDTRAKPARPRRCGQGAGDDPPAVAQALGKRKHGADRGRTWQPAQGLFA